MAHFDLRESPDVIHPIATTMVMLAQDSMFDVAGERNAYLSIMIAALKDKIHTSHSADYTREVSNKIVLHPGEIVYFSRGV